MAICASLKVMKRFFALSLIGLTALTQQASAIVGGPFDNGYPSAALENGAVYQAAMTFKNGNGYCYFSPEQEPVPEDGTNILQYDRRTSMRNRAIVYYKGISYVGSAFGMADLEARYVQCVMNGASEFGYSSTAGTSTTAGTTTTATASTTIVQSQRSFVFNGSWEAKIKQSSPTMRFYGKGEMTFITQLGPDAVSTLRFSAAELLINSIAALVASLAEGNDTVDPAIFSAAQTAIDNVLNNLESNLSVGALDQAQDFGDVVKMKVRGTLRYL